MSHVRRPPPCELVPTKPISHLFSHLHKIRAVHTPGVCTGPANCSDRTYLSIVYSLPVENTVATSPLAARPVSRSAWSADMGGGQNGEAKPNGAALPGRLPSADGKGDVEAGGVSVRNVVPKDGQEALKEEEAAAPASVATEAAEAQEDGPQYTRVTYFDILKIWSLMGYIGFGGPAAHIGEADARGSRPRPRPTRPAVGHGSCQPVSLHGSRRLCPMCQAWMVCRARVPVS